MNKQQETINKKQIQETRNQQDQHKAVTTSNSAGPSETGKCGNTSAPSTEAPSKGEIWYDDERI